MVEMILMEYPHFFTSKRLENWDLSWLIIFRHLVKGGSFSACWNLAGVDPVS